MSVVQDALVAFLAAIGLTSLVWLGVEILCRRRERTGRAVIMLPLYGAAEEMETSVQALQRERELPLLLVDCGLSEEALHRAQLLVRDGEGVELVVPEDLPTYVT